jgi:hypothetical protein
MSRLSNLNDVLRQTFQGGKIMKTASVAALAPDTQARVLQAMRMFSDFNEDNDPHGEHDCALFDVDGESFMFKIDYYDADMEYGSEDPTDPAKTTRVLTLMLPSDY